MSTIHLHLHIDNTPTQELPAIDPEVPSCTKLGPSERDKLIGEINIQRGRANRLEGKLSNALDKANTSYDTGFRDGSANYEAIILSYQAREAKMLKELATFMYPERYDAFINSLSSTVPND